MKICAECDWCKHSYPYGLRCKRIVSTNLITGEKTSPTCEEMRSEPDGLCGASGRMFETRRRDMREICKWALLGLLGLALIVIALLSQ